ncbi:MAG: adenosylcobinamide-GDP ribazoletransferase [Chloroflexi bacterium]|nr:adenosylcobinamide-GDP ribazoletransferase [Chloroflexota bacterium]
MRLLAALSFLTSIPIRREFTPNQVGRSLAFFPVVGALLGAILVALDVVLARVFPSLVVNAGLLVATILLTAALHLDGWMDCCDGLFGHKTLDARLRIMREPQVGAFGVAGGVLMVLLKFAALASLTSPLRTLALVIAPVFSRWAMAYAVFVYPYGRASGKGSVFKENARRVDLIIATILALAFTLPLVGGVAIAILGLAWLIAILVARFAIARIEGLTGDVYGAINECVEVLLWLMLTIQF